MNYAWVDNKPFVKGQTGWISTFVNGLRSHLNRALPRALVADPVWLDYEAMRGSDNISGKIREKLEASRLLVPILSEGWLDSAWCRQELEIFLQHHGPDSGRIFPVWMSPANDPTSNLPPALDELVKYKFWYQDESKRTRTRWLPDRDPTDREYGFIQQDMAEDMAARLREIAASEPALDGSGSPSATGTGESIARKPSPGRLVLVNGGEEDAGLVHEVVRLLAQSHGVTAAAPLSVLKDKSGLKSSEITRDLREKLKLCSAVLIVYKQGPAHQIHRQLTEYLKVLPKRPKDRPPPTLDLCRPDGGPLELGFLPAEMKEHLCGDDSAADCVLKFAAGLP